MGVVYIDYYGCGLLFYSDRFNAWPSGIETWNNKEVLIIVN